jgi:hypothetical protein
MSSMSSDRFLDALVFNSIMCLLMVMFDPEILSLCTKVTVNQPTSSPS